ncbi:hypothetical protein COLO4_09294 [Corchorus olitorius]|uniref:Uncharacterized protein n=1 Tax=Corchorus olitorius TaxID=93759 RepID=A0A1R3KCN4_9ROSI|nr:hypothetical protein COLO4_09294 [Corchorus olitorius]
MTMAVFMADTIQYEVKEVGILEVACSSKQNEENMVSPEKFNDRGPDFKVSKPRIKKAEAMVDVSKSRSKDKVVDACPQDNCDGLEDSYLSSEDVSVDVSIPEEGMKWLDRSVVVMIVCKALGTKFRILVSIIEEESMCRKDSFEIPVNQNVQSQKLNDSPTPANNFMGDEEIVGESISFKELIIKEMASVSNTDNEEIVGRWNERSAMERVGKKFKSLKYEKRNKKKGRRGVTKLILGAEADLYFDSEVSLTDQDIHYNNEILKKEADETYELSFVLGLKFCEDKDKIISRLISMEEEE